MPRKVKVKYHYLYKTTNLINGNYYVGIHSTYEMKDGYLGSGTRLWNSIYKYGKENFIKEELEFFESREELVQREKEIVNEQLLQDSLCMNLKPGGDGGFCSEEHKKKWIKVGSDAGNKKQKELWESDKDWIEKQKEIRKNYWNDPEYRKKALVGFSFKDKKHSNETKNKIGKTNSLKQKGENNSQFGTMWINNGKEVKKIRKEEFIKYKGWKLGRKI